MASREFPFYEHLHPGYEKGATTLGFIYNNVDDEEIMVALDHSRMRRRSKEFPENCKEHESKEGRKASAAEVSKWLADFLPSDYIKDMSLDKAAELAKRALCLAVYYEHGRGECVSGKLCDFLWPISLLQLMYI
ncbi:OLC1v1006497C1 [Oldenlandia corymbosa var. corymbosa]|uniref:OLC1v1006497C1 n=1 Tax=Oldenlandia corymbosa var. corymbosa TaxID=529605 RepID=A0AAV1DHT6_OLDCO|nr:OLC1v1006497C1 [Oldenlandia corymbosa var. corymbosa]